MIKNKIGFSFALPIVFFGILLTLVGVSIVFSTSFIGAIPTFLGCFFWANSYGTEIDIHSNRFREYGKVFWIKKGKWNSLEKTPHLTILKSKEGVRLYGQTNRSTVLFDNKFDVCLLNSTHRIKFIIQKFENKKMAEDYATFLSEKLKKDIVQFSPQKA